MEGKIHIFYTFVIDKKKLFLQWIQFKTIFLRQKKIKNNTRKKSITFKRSFDARFNNF